MLGEETTEMKRGMVTFVGLGPGDSSLRTERAASRLARADVVVDARGSATTRLLELAGEGKHVVRTVDGDAAESRLVVEEARAVARAGARIEVVPGIGAGAAAFAFAGVVGRAALVEASQVDAFLAGKPGDTVVTVIASPGSASQRIVVTTVRETAGQLRGLNAASVVLAWGAPEDSLRWFERQPLFGKRVLVTRARDQASGTAALLRDQGAEPVVVPTIAIRPPADPGPLERALQELLAGAYGWVAFTSANGVERTWDALLHTGGDARAFGAARIAAIGPATARALAEHGLRADLVAPEFRGESLGAEMIEVIRATGLSPRILISRAARARDVLPEVLRSSGHRVDVVAAYETHPASREAFAALETDLERGRLDAVTFTSSSTVSSLCDGLGPRAAERLARVRIASIGPVTTATALERGLRVDVTAAEYTVPGLVRALAESYESPLEPVARTL
jgi:uroporphyrinogen III methyltransferase/synthase